MGLGREVAQVGRHDDLGAPPDRGGQNVSIVFVPKGRIRGAKVEAEEVEAPAGIRPLPRNP